ncbi:MAG TPA: FlgD immunoglobulin-like domain containing protein [Candidatus Krumholzibacteria bacterium]|nr:FlgD immunoglobulin-like domain containing protein [Candidatus Krumholzibacteria bacterium]
MKRFWMITMLALLAVAATAWAAGPVAMPHGGQPAGERETIPADKAFGDPTDFLAAALAGGDYLVYMQADIYEDNAGNGDPDQDLEDGGWDWVLTPFTHSAGSSATNLYGVSALALLASYELDPKIEYFRAMKDAADFIVASGPDDPGGIRSGPDVSFLLRFADLADCPDPAFYRAGAQAIWTRHLNTYGSMANLAAFIRDNRAGQYPNGIIPWDISAWAVAAADMHAAFPSASPAHDLEAITIAEVLYQDSYAGIPGYFEPLGHSQGYDPAWSTVDYYWYTLGVQGLLRSFVAAGTHLAEVPVLTQLLLDSQYPSGAFSDQYGAQGGDEDWQTSAYVLETLADYATLTPAVADALYLGSLWLAGTQDASGGWVYGSGNHYPEIGAENTRGLAAAYALVAPALEINLSDAGPIDCGETNTATVRYVPAAGTPALRGYDVTFEVTGGVVYPAAADIDDAGSLGAIGFHAYYEVDNGTTWTVSDAILGGTVGLEAAADLFTVLITPTGDGPVTVSITDYRLRRLDNTPIFADVTGADFEIDCTAPGVVSNVAAATAHHRVDVSWTNADETDVDHYEIWRAVRHDGTVGDSAYPEYDDYPGYALPVLPADRGDAATGGEWELAGTVPVGTFAFTDNGMDERGVYHYVVFAVDSTPLYGPTPADAWAFNYWLGDVFNEGSPYPLDHDGYVATGDITTLGSAFGSVDGPSPYNNEVDVGPTDDWSGTGFPQTDNVIDFEDLMIFALNYGNVGPAKARTDYDATPPVLAWNQADDGDWVLTLTEPCAGLKGLHVRAGLPQGASVELIPGALLADQIDPAFFLTGRGLDANLAVMGADKGFTGAGELLRARVSGGEPGDLVIDARGLDNAKLDGAVDGGAELPRTFALRPNYPNPFNPKTTISFDLPSTSKVTVEIFGLDGALVRTLLSERRTAGTHSVEWNGLDAQGQRAASGTYLYRVRADGFESHRKMTLMK